ncbi:hypothetical protein BV923_09600 [Pectobacterium odoriferum]|uniref:hypothetical protein n=1 Tax=Pectobacterium odoriferum TaxID=78398 RepID=UPI000CD1EE7B|nr:hypothetical protein [Pectobacterium odoriferum]POE22830.1 hypothetical protein BV923_09600 [Pectobacterium odoriferum]
MTKTTTLQIKQARPNDKEVEAFWKLYRAAQRVENRWCQNTVPLVAEELANTQLSREEKMFLLRAWQVLVDGSGGFSRFMGAFDTYVYNFQDAGDDCIALKPSLRQVWSDGELLPVVLEAYEDAKSAKPHHNGMMQLSQELVAANRRVVELPTQLAELRGQEPFGFINGIATDGGIEILTPVRLLDTDVAVYSQPVPPAASQLERDVSAVVGLLEDQEWAEHCAIRTELGRRLENAITELHNQLSEASQPYTVPDDIVQALITAIEKEQERLFGEDYLMDSKDCIDVIREQVERLRSRRADMLQNPDSGNMVGLRSGINAIRASGVNIDAEKIFAERATLNHPVIPDGWVLVPANANAAMVSAAGRAAREYMEEYGGNSPQVIYQAMLAAAPRRLNGQHERVNNDE